MSKHLMLMLALAVALVAAPVCAAADPAASQIESFSAALMDSMKAGPALGAMARYQRLAPVVERTFDLAAMTKFAVGPAWTGFSPAQQQAMIAAFTRLTTASYAHNFRSFGGERFVVDPNVVTRGLDKVVQAQIVRPQDAPVSLIYRMRQSGDGWKVIDVYIGSISQLTTRRSDFAASIASGGAPSLIAHLNALSDKLMG